MPDKVFPVDIQVRAYDRPGLLRDVSELLADEQVNVMGVNTYTDKKDLIARMELHVEVVDIGQLSKILNQPVVKCHRGQTQSLTRSLQRSASAIKTYVYQSL